MRAIHPMARRRNGVRFGAAVLATLLSGATLPAKASPRARETASSAPRRALPAMTLQLSRTPSWAGQAQAAPDWPGLALPGANGAGGAPSASLRPAASQFPAPSPAARRGAGVGGGPRGPGFAELAIAPMPRPGTASPLPQPLAPSDAARLRRIFDAQARGEPDAAARDLEGLADRRLLGHVLADRWLRAAGNGAGTEAGTATGSGAGPGAPDAGALHAWLSGHADHPDAPRIHALLAALLPRGAALPPSPAAVEDAVQAPEVPPEERAPPSRNPVRSAALDRGVRDRAAAGDAEGVRRLIRNTRGMTPAYAALLGGEAAQILFHDGRDEAAFALAAEAAQQAPGRAQPAFVAGLAAWGRGEYAVSMQFFEAAARAEDAAAALRSAAAFWTARAAVRSRKPQLYVSWMLQAAQEPRTFYGLVARRALGLPPGFAWESDLAGEAEMAALAETAGGWRALALLQIGQRDRAEAELRRLWPAIAGNAALSRAVLAVATAAGLEDLAARLAGLAQSADGRPRDFARFPVPRLQPQSGYRVDPALLYAVARQESNFDASAVSPAGARGLMQILPTTASFVAGDPSLATELGVQRLHDPAFSLELGQRYLLHLRTMDVVGDNLIRMLAAYNAGPGNVGKWEPATRHRDDPFLYIESIPIDETRAYVQRVLAYSWIYASRLGLPSPSLDAVAAGSFPRFLPPEEVARLLRRGRAAAR